MSRGSNNALRMLSTYKPQHTCMHSRSREIKGGVWGNARSRAIACRATVQDKLGDSEILGFHGQGSLNSLSVGSAGFDSYFAYSCTFSRKHIEPAEPA